MKLQKTKTDVYFILLGAKYDHYRRVKPHRFELGTRKAEAQEKANRLWDLWLTQDGLWTEQGLNKGRAIVSGHDRWPGP